MKKMIAMTALALAAATGWAQESAPAPADCPCSPCGPGGGAMGMGPGGGPMMGPRAPMMRGLNLTDAQKAQAREIMARRREETHAQIRAILTPEQQQILDARKKQRDEWFKSLRW